MKKKGFSMVLLFGIVFFLGSVVAQGASGSWQSGDAMDYNGLSEVGTSVSNTASNGSNFQLAVYARRGGMVGYKNVNLLKGQSSKGSFWGQPGIVRFGVVATVARNSHNPWFAG